MKKTNKQNVLIISTNTCEKEIAELKNFLISFNINTITEFEFNDYKKTLLSCKDIIIFLSNDLIYLDLFIEMLSYLLLQHKNYQAYYTLDIDQDYLYSYLLPHTNFKFIKYVHTERLLYHILFSLYTFSNEYLIKNQALEKEYLKDLYFLIFVKYLIYYNLYKANDILKILPITEEEYLQYYSMAKKLYLIIEEKNGDVIIQNEEMLTSYLPSLYKELFKKSCKLIDIYDIFFNIFHNYQEVFKFLDKTSHQKFDLEFEEIYNAYLNKQIVSNDLTNLLNKVKAIRIVNHKIILNIPIKDLLIIRNYLKENIKIDIVLLTKKIFINYVDIKDERINYFLLFHQRRNFNLSHNVKNADIVISLITSLSINNKEFIDNIKNAITTKKKTLFIYIDKVELNLKLQYLIKYCHDMCYWAYKRIDIFYHKYLEQLLSIKDELSSCNLVYFYDVRNLK